MTLYQHLQILHAGDPKNYPAPLTSERELKAYFKRADDAIDRFKNDPPEVIRCRRMEKYPMNLVGPDDGIGECVKCGVYIVYNQRYFPEQPHCCEECFAAEVRNGWKEFSALKATIAGENTINDEEIRKLLDQRGILGQVEGNSGT